MKNESSERARLIALGVIKPLADESGSSGTEKDQFSAEVIKLVQSVNQQIELSASRRNWARLKAGSVQNLSEARRR